MTLLTFYFVLSLIVMMAFHSGSPGLLRVQPVWVQKAHHYSFLNVIATIMLLAICGLFSK